MKGNDTCLTRRGPRPKRAITAVTSAHPDDWTDIYNCERAATTPWVDFFEHFFAWERRIHCSLGAARLAHGKAGESWFLR
jgi:hypothetical protein